MEYYRKSVQPGSLGQYITWRDYPARSAFVDARFYLPPDLLNEAIMAQSIPAVWDALEEAYGFEAILIGYPLPAPHEMVPGRAV